MDNGIFTARIEKSEDGWYVGQLEEIPEVISQGRTIEELNTNLNDALNLVFEQRREESAQKYEGRKTLRHKLNIVQ